TGVRMIQHDRVVRRLALPLFRFYFFFSSRRRHTRCYRDWSSDVCSSDLRRDGRRRGRELRGQVPRRVRGAPRRRVPVRRRVAAEIGRASCRERVWISEVGGPWKRSEKPRVEGWEVRGKTETRNRDEGQEA